MIHHGIASLIAIVSTVFALAVSGCADSTGPTNTKYDATDILGSVPYNVIYSTYSDLNVKAGDLLNSVRSLAAIPTDAALLIAKDAWRHARGPWEQSEGFLFGPVATKGIDPKIDSWPLNKADLDAVLASSTPLTKETVAALENTQKGFHTIEYLLFGQGNNKTAAQLTARELEYLVAVAENLADATKQLADEWNPSIGNYGAQLSTAGSATSLYRSQTDALQELLNGMIGICDEVANAKIADPFAANDRSLEESQFSDNSVADFQDNIRSVQNVYRGTYSGAPGNGLSKMIAAKDSALDVRLQSEIGAAIVSIGQITPTFGDAITNNKASIQAAQVAVQKLKKTLEDDVQKIVVGN